MEKSASGLVCLGKFRMARSDEIIHAETRSLLDYWQGLRAGRAAPFRSEVDPRDMPCEARRLFIIEVGPDGTQRFRLAGTELIDLFGMELRGHPVRIIMDGPAQESMAAVLGEALDEPGISYLRVRPAGQAGDDLWEMLLLPLRSESGKVDRLLGLMRQLSGLARTKRLLPLRFAIDTMWIEPVEITVGGEPDAAVQSIGFAEEQQAFTGLPSPGKSVRFTSIEGGGTRDGNRRHAKPSLRLIKDE